MNDWEALQKAVFEWSIRNFGGQPSTLPLLGIGEEYFELKEATTVEEQRDAIGDIVIYSLDFLGREGIDVGTFLIEPHDVAFDTCVGKVLHIGLKRQQRIRGYEDHDYYIKQMSFWMSHLYMAMEMLMVEPVIDIAWEVWDKVVSKRDWR